MMHTTKQFFDFLEAMLKAGRKKTAEFRNKAGDMLAELAEIVREPEPAALPKQSEKSLVRRAETLKPQLEELLGEVDTVPAGASASPKAQALGPFGRILIDLGLKILTDWLSSRGGAAAQTASEKEVDEDEEEDEEDEDDE